MEQMNQTEMMTNPFAEQIEDLAREMQRRAAKKDFLEYVAYTNPDYKKTKFHTYLCKEIQKFIEKDGSPSFDILCLSVPPQHGKSLTVTESLPAWYLGKNPKKHVIVTTYNTDFVVGFGRKNIEKAEYYNPDIFDNFKLASNPHSNTEFATTLGGGLYAAGIQGGLTGHRANLLIIDDPIKTREEAYSDTTKNKIYGEFINSVCTRMAAKGKIIIIQTRWVEDDLFGRVVANNKDVKVINIPCECDDEENDPLGRKLGDSLCPEIGKGRAWLRSYKEQFTSNEGSMAWNALFQGRPVAQQGNMFRRDWWRYYDCDYKELELPYIIISVDAAFKDNSDNDFVAIQVWGKKGKNYYLIDLIKQHLNFVDTLAAIRNFKSRYPETIFILIEDKANGTAVINVLSSEMEGIIPIKPEGGKVTRANAVSPAVESGHVYLPRFANFLDDFIAECSAFPNAAHDDQVDAMTQALNRMIYVDADVIAPTFIKYSKWLPDMFEDYHNADDALKEELIARWGYPENDEDL